jgi:hypothetical protein
MPLSDLNTSEHVDFLKKYLRMNLDCWDHNCKIVPDRPRIVHPYQTILDHGTIGEKIVVDEWEMMEIKQCYLNSMQMAVEHDLRYVEGFCFGIIPIAHAWNLDKNGNVVDVTLRPHGDEPYSSRAYLGLEIPLKHLINLIRETGTSSVLADTWGTTNRLVKEGAWWKGE